MDFPHFKAFVEVTTSTFLSHKQSILRHRLLKSESLMFILYILLHHLVSCHQLSNKGLLGKQQGLYDFMYCSVFWEIVYCPSDGSKYDTTHEPLARSRRFHPKTDPEFNCIRMFLILPALSWEWSLTEFPYAHWEFVVSLYLRLLCPATGYFLTQLYFIRESFMPVWALKCSNCESPNVVYGGKNKNGTFTSTTRSAKNSSPRCAAQLDCEK